MPKIRCDFPALTPKETALLPNYPNPFIPETWVPYQLAEAADVMLTIYAVDGLLARTLVLGYRPAGIYQGKSRAAYWDGKNAVGESVASGVYFYTLTAEDFTATRKMLIQTINNWHVFTQSRIMLSVWKPDAFIVNRKVK